jgi:hypothetical protein
MKVQVLVNIELPELDSCKKNNVIIDANNLSEIIADFYAADQLAEIIRNKLIDEDISGDGDTEYYLPENVYKAIPY